LLQVNHAGAVDENVGTGSFMHVAFQLALAIDAICIATLCQQTYANGLTNDRQEVTHNVLPSQANIVA